MRDYTKFFTPDEHADFMADVLDLQDGDYVLDPHAGDGKLVVALRKRYGSNIKVDAVEINKEYVDLLPFLCDSLFVEDFLQHHGPGEYDACIDNPPFGNETDLKEHFDHVRELVKIGGTIVMIVPESFNVGTSCMVKPIKNWSTNSDGTITEIKIVMFKNY